MNDKSFLSDLRQQLLLIRLWGSNRESCQPAFTRTAADSFDVVAKLFALVTKYGHSPNDEAFIGELYSALLTLNDSQVITRK